MQFVAFPFLYNYVGRRTHVHIPGWQWQESLGSNFEKVIQGAGEIIFTHDLVTNRVVTVTLLKVFGMWRSQL